MQLRFLGTGNCAGVPAFNCNCPACNQAREFPSLVRRPCCGRISTPETSILIDAGRMDLAELLEQEPVERILLTHYHVDHVQGLFHLRWGVRDTSLPVHGPDDPHGCADLLKHPGILDFTETLSPFSVYHYGDVFVTPLPLKHSKRTLGYAIEHGGKRIAWLTDTSSLPPESGDFLKRWRPGNLIVDCTFPPLAERHSNHNDIAAVTELAKEYSDAQIWLTHISHTLEVWLMEYAATLPTNMQIARDGVVMNIE